MRVYGFHPVREALRHRAAEVERVLVGRTRGGRRRAQIEALCADLGVELRVVGEEELRGAPEAVHNGFAADLQATAELPTAAASDLLVLAEDIQDPRNLGALLRVCDGAGVGRVLLRERGSAPLSPAAIKASAGAAEWLAVEHIGSSAQALERLKEDGYWIYGAAAEGEPPWAVDLTGKVVLCIGGEEHGLRQHTREVCDRLIGLPMRGRVESLNLATAAAALLYEAVRQRMAKQG